MATCRSCHAHVLWAVTPQGKAIPLDAEPVETGTVVIHPVLRGRPRRCHFVKGGEPTGPRHTPHLNTCVDAAQWRGGRQRV